jgi:hypothetical protein
MSDVGVAADVAVLGLLYILMLSTEISHEFMKMWPSRCRLSKSLSLQTILL